MVAVDLAEIQARAEQMRPGRFFLTLAAAPFVVAGFVASFAVAYGWRASRFCVAAFAVGMQRARGPSKAQQLAELRRQNEEMRIQISRILGPGG